MARLATDDGARKVLVVDDDADWREFLRLSLEDLGYETTEASDGLAVTAVLVDSDSARNTILDSGTDAQVVVDRAANAFRATPAIAG